MLRAGGELDWTNRISHQTTILQASTVATVCSMEASYQLAVTEEDLEKCLNYCRSVQPRMMKHLIESIIVIVFLEYSILQGVHRTWRKLPDQDCLLSSFPASLLPAHP